MTSSPQCPGDGCEGCPECAAPIGVKFTGNFVRKSKKWRPWRWSSFALYQYPDGSVRQHTRNHGSAFFLRTAKAACNAWEARIRREWRFVWTDLSSDSK